jgi:hypothetical protein
MEMGITEAGMAQIWGRGGEKGGGRRREGERGGGRERERER